MRDGQTDSETMFHKYVIDLLVYQRYEISTRAADWYKKLYTGILSISPLYQYVYVGCSAINENGLVSPKVKIAWQRKYRKLKTQV